MKNRMEAFRYREYERILRKLLDTLLNKLKLSIREI